MATECVTRTIRVPVAEILEGGTKTQFYKDLRDSLDTARRAANKSLVECFRSDAELMTGGKCPKLYTYPFVSTSFGGAKSIASSICRAVETKYKQDRWEVANGMKSACEYRSFPWTLLCNKSTKTVTISDEGEYLAARIKLIGGWWTVRIACGSSHRRQNHGIRNALKIGDSKIWIDRKHRAILGLSCQVEVKSGRNLSGVLNVSTKRDAFLVATKERNEIPFVITGVHVRRWQRERDRRMQRLRKDRKSGGRRRYIGSQMAQVSEKYKRRIDSFIHESTAHIVEHARRRKIKTVRLDMTVKSWCKSFPWFQLAEKIKYKCENYGIEFINATQQVKQPDLLKPHVYFTLSSKLEAVKIGKTSASTGKRAVEEHETSNPDELVVLAIDNQPKSKVTGKEKHYHAMFDEHRLKERSSRGNEWFRAEPVVAWLREAGWLGNAGNLSQIAQVMEV